MCSRNLRSYGDHGILYVDEDVPKYTEYKICQMNDELMKKIQESKDKSVRFVQYPRFDDNPYKIYVVISIEKVNVVEKNMKKSNSKKKKKFTKFGITNIIVVTKVHGLF
jgi:hypothetical protein